MKNILTYIIVLLYTVASAQTFDFNCNVSSIIKISNEKDSDPRYIATAEQDECNDFEFSFSDYEYHYSWVQDGTLRLYVFGDFPHDVTNPRSWFRIAMPDGNEYVGNHQFTDNHGGSYIHNPSDESERSYFVLEPISSYEPYNCENIEITVIGNGTVNMEVIDPSTSLVALTFIPDDGHEFMRWDSNGKYKVSNSNQATTAAFSLKGDKVNLTAVFGEEISDSKIRINSYPWHHYSPLSNYYAYVGNSSSISGNKIIKMGGTYVYGDSSSIHFNEGSDIDNFEVGTSHEFEVLDTYFVEGEITGADSEGGVLVIQNIYGAETGDEFVMFKGYGNYRQRMFTGTITASGNYIILNIKGDLNGNFNLSQHHFTILE